MNFIFYSLLTSPPKGSQKKSESRLVNTTVEIKLVFLVMWLKMSIFVGQDVIVMDQYRGAIKALASRRENKVFLNSSEEHALIVLSEIINDTQNDLRIFAGNLCNSITEAPEYISAISRFIERDGVLKILLNNYNEECLKNSSFYKRLAYFEKQGKPVTIKKTNIHPQRESDPSKKEVHFTVGDERAYRLETDIENRTAEGNFNSPDVAKVLATWFDRVFEKETEAIYISELL